MKSKLSIYLAGPIKGVKKEESLGWREIFKVKYDDKFDIAIPQDRDKNYRDMKGKELYEAIANGERMDILNSDIIIAYLDRDSMGTAMGIMYAFLSGRTVVVVKNKPDMELSKMVLYHSHKVCDSFEEAVEFIEKRHKRCSVKKILKRNGEIADWNPKRIEDVIQAAIDGNRDKLRALEVEPPRADKLATTVIMQIEDELEDGRISYDDIDVETIQDMVEKVLIDNSHRKEVNTLAKEYIVYRRKKHEIREKSKSDTETLKFIYDMLHDIKAPGANIGRYCNMLKEVMKRQDFKKSNEFLETIESNQNRIMKKLLSCKVEGEKRFKKEVINLKDLFEKQSKDFSCHETTIHNLIPENLYIEAQPSRIDTTFRNLIENSIKHGFREEKGNIYIRAEAHRDRQVVIDYWNDGKSISMKEAANIFYGISRPSAIIESFGHGMSQVKTCIEELGGSIECIPMLEKSDTAKSLLIKSEEGMPVFRIVLMRYEGIADIKKKILIADDIDSERLMMKDILESGGYDTVEAGSIGQALDIIDKEDIYGAVLDVDFKEDKTGLWLLEYLYNKKPHVRVIVVSGLDSQSSIRLNWRDEADKYRAFSFDKASYSPNQILDCFEV